MTQLSILNFPQEILNVVEEHITPQDSASLSRVSKDMKMADMRPCGVRFDHNTECARENPYCDTFVMGTDVPETKAQMLCLTRKLNDKLLSPVARAEVVMQVEVDVDRAKAGGGEGEVDRAGEVEGQAGELLLDKGADPNHHSIGFPLRSSTRFTK